MDDIKFFGSESQIDEEDLPWGKDWIKITNSPHEPMEVISCRVGLKGILIETGSYKTFIFKKEKTFVYLEEALKVWSDKGLPTKPLIVAYVNKRFCYGINQSKPDVSWYSDDGVFRSKRVSDAPTLNRRHSNPFLPSDNPTELIPPQSEIARKRKERNEKPPEEAAKNA